MYTYTHYTCIYIYIYIERERDIAAQEMTDAGLLEEYGNLGLPQEIRGNHLSNTTPNLPTNIVGFRGSDSSRLFNLRGGNFHVRRI